MDLTMPGVLAWVLGGNASNLRFQDRTPHCRLPDKPKTFDEQARARRLLRLLSWPHAIAQLRGHTIAGPSKR